MKIGTMLMLIVAIVAGTIAAFSARSILNGRRPVGQNADATIVVADKTLAFGTVIEETNVSEIPWSSSTLPDGAFKSKTELMKEGRRVVLSRIEKNEPILASRVTGPGQRGALSALIEPGMRAVTVRVDDVRGVAGFVMPGDHVDVVLSRVDNASNATATSYADVLLQNVKVLAVDQVANDHQENPTVVKAVTVEVSTEQAEKLVLASGVGSLSLVLRQAGGAEPTASHRVTLVDLGQGEYVSGDKNDGKNLLLTRRIEELEAKLSKELNKPVAAPHRSSASVRIWRATQPEDYNVFNEAD